MSRFSLDDDGLGSPCHRHIPAGCALDRTMNTDPSVESFRIGQRVHSVNDPRRVGTVMYVGGVEGYSGTWIGVDWDNDGEGKHDGSVNGVRYFQAHSQSSASFVRPRNLSHGLTLLQALELRYRTVSTKDEEDEMYVLSAGNKRVSVQLLGKDKIQDKLSRLDELTSASLFHLGVSSLDASPHLASVLPNLKELDLTGNLISEWKEIGALCEHLPSLTALNLSFNSLTFDNTNMPQLNNIHVLVLNSTGISWTEVEMIGCSLPNLEELHLIGNNIASITAISSSSDQAFKFLRLLNLDDNCFTDWTEISKLSLLRSLEELYLNNNKLSHIYYPDRESLDGYESLEISCKPFQRLHSLLLGANNIEDLASVDSLNLFPELVDIRLSDNPITDPSRGGVPRYVLVARLIKVQVLNGSEVRAREKKESEIRYVRLVMTKFDDLGEIELIHPRFYELKKLHGIDDERSTAGLAGPQNMASGFICVTLKCVGASMGERPVVAKKLPRSTTVGKLKILCENFFKLKGIKPKLYLQEEGDPLPASLDDEMATLLDMGICEGSTVLVDEES